MELVKKLTVKKACGDLRPLLVDMAEGEKKPVFRVIGQVSKTGVKATDLGEYIDMRGRFRGTNLVTGEVFNSARCILPETASEPVHEQLALGEEKGVQAVEFAYDIGIQKRESAIRGYEFFVVPLVAVSEDDPLERLANRVAGDKQLEAPKSEPEAPAAPPTPEKTKGKGK